MNRIIAEPGRVTLDALAQVLGGVTVELDTSYWPDVDAAAAIVAKAAQGGEPVYGINTGFGKLASKRIPPDQTAQLQRNLIASKNFHDPIWRTSCLLVTGKRFRSSM